MYDLSVIIPFYKDAKCHVKPLLGSLMMQDFTGITVEYIFVLDSCLPGTKELLQKWCEVADCVGRTKFIEGEFGSAGGSRNVGLDNATGKYVWMLDDDDWLIDTLAFRKVIHVLDAGRDMTRLSFAAPEHPACRNEHLFTVISMPWQWVFRRDLIGDTRFPTEPPVGYDTVFIENIIKKRGSTEVFKISDNLYYYNFLRPGSEMYKEFIRCGYDPRDRV